MYPCNFISSSTIYSKPLIKYGTNNNKLICYQSILACWISCSWTLLSGYSSICNLSRSSPWRISWRCANYPSFFITCCEVKQGKISKWQINISHTMRDKKHRYDIFQSRWEKRKTLAIKCITYQAAVHHWESQGVMLSWSQLLGPERSKQIHNFQHYYALKA